MDHASSEHLSQDQFATGVAPISAPRTLVWAAWISTLLLSNLPLAIARDLLGSDIPWITPAWIGIAGLLWVSTYFWPAIRSLRRYFLLMGVIILLTFVVNPFVTHTAAWRNWEAGQAPMVVTFAHRVLLILETLAVLAALFLIGVKRREAFLQAGNVRAPVGGQASTQGKRGLPWPLFATIVTLLLGSGFFFFMAAQNPGWSGNLAAVLPWIPLILVSAALNALGEEAKYRAAPLALLLPAVGPNHGVWLTLSGSGWAIVMAVPLGAFRFHPGGPNWPAQGKSNDRYTGHRLALEHPHGP